MREIMNTNKIKHDVGGIGEKVFLDIGNVKQGMIIKGNDTKKPVLLFCQEDLEYQNIFWITGIPIFWKMNLLFFFWTGEVQDCLLENMSHRKV